MELTPDAHNILASPLITWRHPKHVRSIETFGRLVIANAVDIRQKMPKSRSNNPFHDYQTKKGQTRTEYQKGKGHGLIRLMVEVSESAMRLEMQRPTTWFNEDGHMFIKNNLNRIDLSPHEASFTIIQDGQKMREAIPTQARLAEVATNYLERLEDAADLTEVMEGRAVNAGHRQLLNHPDEP